MYMKTHIPCVCRSLRGFQHSPGTNIYTHIHAYKYPYIHMQVLERLSTLKGSENTVCVCVCIYIYIYIYINTYTMRV